MKQEVALAIVLASMSDHDVLCVYQASAMVKDPRTRQIGRELLVRFHRADPVNFPKEMIDKYDNEGASS